ncbi:hypothetical protein C0J52_16200 [Blattella germanica]|nr:hypothetical protein C0J52_16200 [Blattella germanica]
MVGTSRGSAEAPPHTLLESMPALYTQMRKEPGFTRDAQKLIAKHRRRSPTALPKRYTDHESSHVPEKVERNQFTTCINYMSK